MQAGYVIGRCDSTRSGMMWLKERRSVEATLQCEWAVSVTLPLGITHLDYNACFKAWEDALLNL
jgi:hypothetical protein